VQAVKLGTPQILLELTHRQKLAQDATLSTLQAERLPLKAPALPNIWFMLVTLATAHDERLPLKTVAP
jgi:hypothetical protein